MERSLPVGEIWLANDRRLAIVLLSFWLIPLIWFVTTDFRLYQPDEVRLYLRLLTRALSIVVPAVGIAYVYRSATRAQYSRAVFAVSAAAAILLLVLNLQRPIGMPLPVRTPMLFLILAYAAIHTRPYPQAVVPIAYTAGLAIQHALWSPSLSTSIGDLLVLGVINAIGITLVARRNRLEAELHEAWDRELTARRDAAEARRELKAIREIVRVCSYCRKVETEPRGWQRLEAFILDNFGVEFSHGLCPHCRQLHYPEFSGDGV